MGKGERVGKRLARRRLCGGRPPERGVAQAEVARREGISRTTVNYWHARLADGGLDALRARPRGRPARLDTK